jgi:MATE family multidrug resistance protein
MDGQAGEGNISYQYPWYYDEEPFEGYAVHTNTTGIGFCCFVLVYTVLSFAVIAPLVKWSKHQEEKKLMELEDATHPQQTQQNSPHDLPTPQASNSSRDDQPKKTKKSAMSEISTSRKSEYASNSIRDQKSNVTATVSKQPPDRRRSSSVTTTGSQRSSALRSVILRELDQSYPDMDPEFRAVMMNTSHSVYRNSTAGAPEQGQQQGNGSKATTEASSSAPAPSVATTSKVFTMQNPSNKRFSTRVLDVSGRRWKNRRPIGRVDVIQNAVASELSSLGGDGASAAFRTSMNSHAKKEGSSNNSIGRPPGSIIPPHSHHLRQRGMSDVASSILSEQHHQLNQPQVQVDISEMKRQQQLLQQLQFQQLQMMHQHNQLHMHPFVMHRLATLQRHQQQRRYSSSSRRSFRGSRSISSERSIMSSIVDDISPNDAADANDPGRGNVFVDLDVKYLPKSQTQSALYRRASFGIKAGCCTVPVECILSLAAPSQDKRRVLISSIPLALGASSEALFRLITTAFISRYLGTDSMVAFLLVGLFVRLTSEELTDAIIDALSAFVQASMQAPPPPGGGDVSSANSFLAGQYVQLAVVLQLVLNIPLLLLWVVCMEKVVIWFVNDPTIAAIAQDYAFVVVFAYLVQSLSRTLTVIFHICGHEHFESIIDIAASTLQLIAIACVSALVDDASLTTVGYVQVLITISAAIAKILFPVMRGWMQPFRKGLINNMALFQNKFGIWHLLKAAGPLLLGTILEYGEWELLTIFVRHLGPAEVATWALLGAFWDVLEALTEGIGEAAANHVAFLLSVGLVDRAKDLSYGAMYMAVVQSLLVTAALYMSGQYLAVAFTADPTIQHLMNDTIAMLGFANIIMSFAQIAWSLVGAQGRFRLATLAVFLSRWLVAMPCALISIYAFFLDLNAVSGSLVLGYATATSAMFFVLLRSDWERLANIMMDVNQSALGLEDSEEVDNQATGDQGLGFVDLDDFDDSADSDSEGFG